jgi:hypothetical protein
MKKEWSIEKMELWYRCRDRATMIFPYEEEDGSISENYWEHEMWEDGHYGR